MRGIPVYAQKSLLNTCPFINIIMALPGKGTLLYQIR